MRNIIIALFLTIIQFTPTSAQSKKELKGTLQEATRLYSLEKARKVAVNMIHQRRDPDFWAQLGGNGAYHSGDTIKVIHFNRKADTKIGQFFFTSANLDKPFKVSFKKEAFTTQEKEWFKIYNELMRHILQDGLYNLEIPKGTSHNFMMLKKDKGYHLHMINGTLRNHTIPFGNDYVFEVDLSGKVTLWRKYRRKYMPLKTKVNGNSISSLFFTSLEKKPPFITPNDICTFLLYSQESAVKEFSVLSTFNKKKYTYSKKDHSIKVKNIN